MVRKLKPSAANSQQNIIQKAKQMQEAMLNIQEGLKNKIVETSVAGGQILLKANGQKEIIDIKISSEIIEEAAKEKDNTEIEKLLVSAINDVLSKANDLAEEEMSVVTNGVNIPGLF